MMHAQCRWACLKKCIQLHDKNAAIVTCACCTLHNLLIRESLCAYLHRSARQPVHRMPTGVWQERDVLDLLHRLRGHKDYHLGQAIRGNPPKNKITIIKKNIG